MHFFGRTINSVACLIKICFQIFLAAPFAAANGGGVVATATIGSTIEMSTIGIIFAVGVTVLNIAILAVLLVHRARKRKLKQKRKDAAEAPAKSSG